MVIIQHNSHLLSIDFKLNNNDNTVCTLYIGNFGHTIDFQLFRYGHSVVGPLPFYEQIYSLSILSYNYVVDK